MAGLGAGPPPRLRDERAQLAVIIAGIRWAGVALATFEALAATPAPISVAIGLAATGVMAAYNIPATFARRLRPEQVRIVLAVGLVGDFLVVTAWLLLSVNDPQDLTFVTYFLVAVEGAVLYQWRAAVPLAAASVAAIVCAWIERSVLYHVTADPGNLVLRCALVAMSFAFLGQIAETSERRRAAALEQSGRNEALHVVASRLGRTLKQEYVLDTVVDSLARIYPNRWHGILLLNPENVLELRYVRGMPTEISLVIRHPEAYESGPIRFVDIRTDERVATIRAELPEEVFQYAGGVAVPLRGQDELFGLLVTFDRRPGGFPPDEVGFLESIAAHASLAVENARLYEEVETLSLTDSTTALYNRRAFDLRLHDEIERARRYGVPLSLLMIDVDHFKLYNDTHGHPAGDRLLRKLGDVLAHAELRSTDVPFRFGGEEFAVIMPHTDARAAETTATRIKAAVGATAFPDGADQPLGRVTVSIGCAAFPDDASDPAELVERADLALYEAKRRGRDLVVTYRGRTASETTPST